MAKKKVSELSPELSLLEDRLKKFLRWELMAAEASLREDWKKDVKNEIINVTDKIMGELQAIREEQEILSSQHGRILDLEDKVENLEKIHPKNSHSPLVA